MQVTTSMRKKVVQMTEAQQKELMEQVPVFQEKLIQLIKQGVADYRLLEITPCAWSLKEQKVVSTMILPLNDEEVIDLYVTPNVLNACTDYKFADPKDTPPLPGTRIQFSDGIQDLRGTVIRYT